jgi:cytochrome c556
MRTLVVLMFLVFLFNLPKAEELPKVMLKMENDTVKILKGFLRNNNKMIIEGAKEIANHPNIIEEIYNYAKPERRTEAFKKYIQEFDNFVREEANLIAKYIKEGKKAKASTHFAKLIDRCNGCHAVFRGW